MLGEIKSKNLSVVVAALLVASLASACSSHDSATTPQNVESVGAANQAANANDVMFAQMMIPHHEQAVVMADLALAKSTDPEIVQLATEIKGAQGPEIELMSTWLSTWGAPRISGAEAMASHGSHGMAGMLTDEQLASLEAAQGAEFNELFAQFMIEHHEGAVSMAQDVVAGGQDQAVTALANEIINVQQREIAQLQAMLTE